MSGSHYYKGQDRGCSWREEDGVMGKGQHTERIPGGGKFLVPDLSGGSRGNCLK